MEVTKDNFDELLPEILEAIENCTFIAVDAELTGLHLSDEKDNYFDSVEERYKMVRQSSTHFLLVQFGMVLFFYDPSTDEFSHRAYNFYVFPKQIANSSPNVRFTCEASSLEFLASWGFDFNKLIYKGIPYLTVAVEQKMKDNYDKKQLYLHEENSTPCPVPENLKKFMEETQKQIRSLANGEVKEIFLEELSPFQRKLVFNNIKPKYSALYFETIVRDRDQPTAADPTQAADLGMDSSVSDSQSSDNESSSTTARRPPTPGGNRPCRVLRVAKMSESERKARDDEKKRQIFETIDKGVGFSKVIRKISNTGKIVVGHNMILDVAHSVRQFVSDLPEDLSSFKTLVQTAFPNLVDTKLMCCTHPFREHFASSVLGDVLKRVQDDPFGLPVIKKEDKDGTLSYSLEDSKMHEAGYDAFITGVCFIGLCQYLGKLQVPQKKRVLPESPLVMPFLNKLYLMRMLDISYLNISGTDLTPSRDHVFHVSCPKEATTKSIVSLFSTFGQVQVWWQDDNNLFVSLNDKDQAAFVMKNIEIDKSSNYRVIPFTQYQSCREKMKRPLQRDSPERPARGQQQKSSSESAGGVGGGGGAGNNNKHHGSSAKGKQQQKKKGGGGGGGAPTGRQHSSASTSSTHSSSSEGSLSPPLSGSESVHHQKKKRPKTETSSTTASNNGKGKGSSTNTTTTSGGGRDGAKNRQPQQQQQPSSRDSSSAAKLHFEEPSTWD